MKMKMMTKNEAVEWLRDADNILILSHKRPDGDAIGSASALASGLRMCGKTAYTLENPEITSKFVEFAEKYYAPAEFVPEHIVTVDTASAEMIQLNASKYTASVELSIDHHISNTGYAHNTCVMAECAACGEIIYAILEILNGKVDDNTATLLYIAVSTDTGCFAYANTNANTLYTAAKLVEYGADNKKINKILFRTKSKGRLKFEGVLLSSLEFCFNGKVAFMAVMLSDREKYGIDENDLDDIASIPGSAEGVCVGITIKEIEERESKVSVRTAEGYNANLLCSVFNGGGHNAAAGCSIKGTVEEVKELLKKEIDTLWNF